MERHGSSGGGGGGGGNGGDGTGASSLGIKRMVGGKGERGEDEVECEDGIVGMEAGRGGTPSGYEVAPQPKGFLSSILYMMFPSSSSTSPVKGQLVPTVEPDGEKVGEDTLQVHVDTGHELEVTTEIEILTRLVDGFRVAVETTARGGLGGEKLVWNMTDSAIEFDGYTIPPVVAKLFRLETFNYTGKKPPTEHCVDGIRTELALKRELVFDTNIAVSVKWLFVTESQMIVVDNVLVPDAEERMLIPARRQLYGVYNFVWRSSDGVYHYVEAYNSIMSDLERL